MASRNALRWRLNSMSLATFLRCATLAGMRGQSERDIQNQSVGGLLKSKCQVLITHTDECQFRKFS